MSEAVTLIVVPDVAEPEDGDTVNQSALEVTVQSTSATTLKDAEAFLGKEIKVELTPYQQKIEDEINEFLHQAVTWQKIHDFLFQEVTFGKKNKEQQPEVANEE